MENDELKEYHKDRLYRLHTEDGGAKQAVLNALAKEHLGWEVKEKDEPPSAFVDPLTGYSYNNVGAVRRLLRRRVNVWELMGVRVDQMGPQKFYGPQTKGF